MTTSLTAADYRKVAVIQDKIDTLEKEKAKILGTTPKRPITTETRAKMKAAQQERRAKEGKGGKAKPAVKKKKREMTAAAKAKISASQKARWAKKKAGK